MSGSHRFSLSILWYSVCGGTGHDGFNKAGLLGAVNHGVVGVITLLAERYDRILLTVSSKDVNTLYPDATANSSSLEGGGI
jgi:hypothetical protein